MRHGTAGNFDIFGKLCPGGSSLQLGGPASDLPATVEGFGPRFPSVTVFASRPAEPTFAVPVATLRCGRPGPLFFVPIRWV